MKAHLVIKVNHSTGKHNYYIFSKYEKADAFVNQSIADISYDSELKRYTEFEIESIKVDEEI